MRPLTCRTTRFMRAKGQKRHLLVPVLQRRTMAQVLTSRAPSMERIACPALEGAGIQRRPSRQQEPVGTGESAWTFSSSTVQPRWWPPRSSAAARYKDLPQWSTTIPQCAEDYSSHRPNRRAESLRRSRSLVSAITACCRHRRVLTPHPHSNLPTPCSRSWIRRRKALLLHGHPGSGRPRFVVTSRSSEHRLQGNRPAPGSRQGHHGGSRFAPRTGGGGSGTMGFGQSALGRFPL